MTVVHQASDDCQAHDCKLCAQVCVRCQRPLSSPGQAKFPAGARVAEDGSSMVDLRNYGEYSPNPYREAPDCEPREVAERTDPAVVHAVAEAVVCLRLSWDLHTCRFADCVPSNPCDFCEMLANATDSVLRASEALGLGVPQ